MKEFLVSSFFVLSPEIENDYGFKTEQTPGIF